MDEKKKLQLFYFRAFFGLELLNMLCLAGMAIYSNSSTLSLGLLGLFGVVIGFLPAVWAVFAKYKWVKESWIAIVSLWTIFTIGAGGILLIKTLLLMPFSVTPIALVTSYGIYVYYLFVSVKDLFVEFD